MTLEEAYAKNPRAYAYREWLINLQQVDIYLSDYLQPGGKFPYHCLFRDLERALTLGNKVYLWSVPGFLMLSAYPNPPSDIGLPTPLPWHKTGEEGPDFRTAAEALAGEEQEWEFVKIAGELLKERED